MEKQGRSRQAPPDGCSCCTARLKALLAGIDAALRSTPPLLQAPDDTKAGLVQLVPTSSLLRSLSDLHSRAQQHSLLTKSCCAREVD